LLIERFPDPQSEIRHQSRDFFMANNMYEMLFLLDSSQVAGDLPAAVAKLHGNLEKHHAEILASRTWDERKPSYPIKSLKKNMKGLYYLIYIRCDPKNMAEMEADFKLNETIVRMLVLLIEPKLEEEMLAVAKDERALALQTAHDEPIDAVEGYESSGSRREWKIRGQKSEFRKVKSVVACRASRLKSLGIKR